MAYEKKNYEQIAVAQITKNREIVISRVDNGGFTIAQRYPRKRDDGTTFMVYAKGAMFIGENHFADVVAAFNRAYESTKDYLDAIDWDTVEDGADVDSDEDAI